MAGVEFRILGPIEVVAEGAQVALGAPKQRALLAELLLHPNAAIPREALIEALWGDDPPKTAVSTLQVYVHGLRQALGKERIETVGNAYRVRVDGSELDLSRFERLVDKGRAALQDGRARDADAELAAALALWRGAPLADVPDVGGTSRAARALEELRLEAVELGNDAQIALGRHELLLPGISRLIDEHPYREKLRAQQVLALYRAGRQTEALEAHRSARAAWRDELGIEPTPAFQELERAILRHDPSLAAPEAPPSPTRRLPSPPTPLIGRRLEIAAVSALLREDARLVTLTGPGGSGKTRLALAVAEELAHGLADGAVFVDLSAVSDPALIVPAIADAVGAPPGTATSGELAEHLSALTLLLVLDNLEQLLAGARRVGELLAGAPRVRILATSRAPLRLAAEHVYPVLPLPLPSEGATSADALMRNEAVRLFAARARAADTSFELDPSTAADVAAVCRRLDGLPLAIELAAARTRILTPGQLLERLPDSLELLVASHSDAPARQATLEATIRWSYDLLGPDERRAFEQLAVFSGGWTEAAAARCFDLDLAVLSALADHSLIRLRRDEPARFSMLETVRRFALARLDEHDGADARRRHADWIVELAEAVEQEVTSSGDVAGSLDRLAAEHDNVRAALAWSLEAAETELAVRLVIALRHFWDVRGHLAEGKRWLGRALAVGDQVPDAQRLELLATAGKLAFHSGDFTEADRRYGEMLEAARAVGDDEAVGRGLSDIGTVAAAVGDYDRAVEFLGESAGRFRALGLQRRLAFVLANLGYVAGEQGDYERATEATQEALAIQRELTERVGEAVSLLNLAGFRIEAGDLARARELLRECLALALELGYREVMVYGLVSLVRIATLEGDAHRSAFLAGAADSLIVDTGVGLLPAAQAELDHAKETARRSLGVSGYEQAHSDGEATPVEDVLGGAGFAPSSAPG